MSSFLALESFLKNIKQKNPAITKQQLARVAAEHYGLVKDRSLYVGKEFVIRFTDAKKGSLSNTILSLSALQKYDDRPCIVCVNEPANLYLLLINSTLIKKVSHSSKNLRPDNVRGSFNGSDIHRSYDDLENKPANFSALWEIHRNFPWEENLLRLVEATNNISPHFSKFSPDQDQLNNIFKAIDLAIKTGRSSEYARIKTALDTKIAKKSPEILAVAQIPSVKERGDRIEEIVHHSMVKHGLEDLKYDLPSGTHLLIDLKTKLFGLSSNPKAYNIDKMLSTLAAGNSVFSFYFLGIDLQKGRLETNLVSFLDETIINCTRVQHHWAGRNTRGVTQLTTGYEVVIDPLYQERIFPGLAGEFLLSLLNA